MTIVEPDALDGLRRAADRGDAGAMTELGSRLLVGRGAPLSLRDGIDWLGRAAERNDVDALNRLAALAAVGATAPPDWPAGLDLLKRAAALGSHEARTQISLLVPADVAAANQGPTAWREMAALVDPAWWRDAPPRRAVCEAPRVRMADAFVSPAVCAWLRGRAEGRLRPATMYHGDTRSEQIDPHRTCSDYQFDIVNTDLVLLMVRERISALTKLPTIAMEPPRVFHYALGQEIKPHFDRCGDPVEGYGKGTGYLGDRIVTFLLYLNDDFDGGDLDFPRANFRCKGAMGDAVYFAHVDMAGAQDPLSLHAGLKITRGEKWVLSQWIHDRPFGLPTPRAG